MEKIRFGIIGLGNQGSTYALQIFEKGEIENGTLSAMCDINPAKIEYVKGKTQNKEAKYFTDYKEMNYEGYGPFGIAIFVETATDNTTRTVANVRSYFNKNGGSLGTSGSLEFLFEHKCVFHIAKKDGMSLEDLELELIDYGVDEVDEDEDEVVLYGEFAQNSAIQKYLEENGYEITSSEFVRIPNDVKEVTPEQRESIEKLIEKLEEDEDVQNVFHNMKEDENGDEE